MARYVANANRRKREVHDREQADGRCHLDKIKWPVEYEVLDDALANGYDLCAWCLRSRR